MRKIGFKYIIAACIGLSALTACNNLDQYPKDRFTDETFWQSESNSEMVVNMAYRQMLAGGDHSGADRVWNDEALSDNLINARGMGDLRMIRNGLADPTLGLFGQEWEHRYAGIKTCHKYLDNIDRVPGMDENLKNRRKSEVRFIRVWNFFRLVSFYGDVPFFTTDITLEESQTISRTPKATVMQFIHDELDQIMPLLPTRDQLQASDNGRVTRGAACALQARVYLYESNWAKVQEYTERLINDQANYGNYALFPNYETLFHSANEYNEEVIFDYAFVPEIRRWGEMYSRVPMTQGAYLNDSAPTQELVDSYITANGLAITEDATYDENDPYKNRDPRLAQTIVYDKYEWVKEDGSKVTIRTNPNEAPNSLDRVGAGNSSVTGYYIRKYWDPKHEASLQQSTNIILLRYADVLLMYAEAMFEQNKMSQAVWDKTIRPIRERAGFIQSSALNYPTLDTESMRELIRNERRTELAMEGIRYHDIVRWKVGSKYLDVTVHGAKFANNGTDYIELDNRKFNDNKDYLWSVPLSQMDLNPNLRPNNPGY